MLKGEKRRKTRGSILGEGNGGPREPAKQITEILF